MCLNVILESRARAFAYPWFLQGCSMPTIVQTASGRVSGLWGSALIRGADGKMHALKMGDVVHRGDVILTTQNGIVQLTPEETITAKTAPAGDDIDRVI